MRYDGQVFQHAMDVRGSSTAPVVAGDRPLHRCSVPGSHWSQSPSRFGDSHGRGIQIQGPVDSELAAILSPEAVAFVAGLHRSFNPRRQELLHAREERQAAIDAGASLDFLPETRAIREANWQVAPAPSDLNDRRVEITGPCDRKMVINALNSGAKVFMADLEDASSPTWSNVVDGQRNLYDAVRRTISFQNPDGREYSLERRNRHPPGPAPRLAPQRTPHHGRRRACLRQPVRLRALFLPQRPGADQPRLRPLFLPAEAAEPPRGSALERRLHLRPGGPRHPHGTVRATVLIETLPAAFEMEEILYELRDHAAGLNAGRWDYIFSAIKTFRNEGEALPDRAQVTMTVPFMRDYTQLLVQTCHSAARTPSAAWRPSSLRAATRQSTRWPSPRCGRTRSGRPATASMAPGSPTRDSSRSPSRIFDRVLGDRPHQKERQRDDVQVDAGELTDLAVPGGQITEAGVRANVSVALQYINAWLQGTGAAAINNLMEDAATAEISRAQIWQWIHNGADHRGGEPITSERYDRIRDEELSKLGGAGTSRYRDAAEILDQLVLDDEFTPFLTIPAYAYLD